MAQSVPEPAARELAPSGKLHAAINYGNPVLAQKGADGEPRGVSAELARELARRLGTPIAFVEFPSAGAKGRPDGAQAAGSAARRGNAGADPGRGGRQCPLVPGFRPRPVRQRAAVSYLKAIAKQSSG
jgi:hypothetical protein